jgi:hypothetical protein
VEQAEANHIRFRELDQDGKPADPGAAGGQDPAGIRNPGRTGFNPFIAILWILAAILTVGGIWVFTNAFSAGPTSSSGAVPLGFILINFAPQAVLTGTLAIMCLLFWHAVQWQRARR